MFQQFSFIVNYYVMCYRLGMQDKHALMKKNTKHRGEPQKLNKIQTKKRKVSNQKAIGQTRKKKKSQRDTIGNWKSRETQEEGTKEWESGQMDWQWQQGAHSLCTQAR